MSTLTIVILWIIVSILIIGISAQINIRKKRKMENEQELTSDINPENYNKNTYTTDNKSMFLADYQNFLIQGMVIKTLETIEIIQKSKNLDIIVGRYSFLKQTLKELIHFITDPRYTSDMQNALESYKRSYYDRIPTEQQLRAITNPLLANEELIFKMSMTKAIANYYMDQSVIIKNLKRQNAIDKRKEDIIEKCKYTKVELSKCNNRSGLDEVYSMIDKIINLVKDNNFDEEFNIQIDITNQ